MYLAYNLSWVVFHSDGIAMGWEAERGEDEQWLQIHTKSTPKTKIQMKRKTIRTFLASLKKKGKHTKKNFAYVMFKFLSSNTEKCVYTERTAQNRTKRRRQKPKQNQERVH